MMKILTTLISAGALLLAQSVSASPAVDAMLKVYRDAGAGPFSAEAGERMWLEKHSHVESPAERSCGSCHTNNLSDSGKHVKTQKVIKPMTPSVNAKRLTDTKQIEKWFMRNCKWTFGRECSPQEKGDFLLYIQKSGV
ncbi:MAG: DUF1924 domain-containing protein [Gammaproteobacteria bacterium]|nr:DUF1924 domain-containing protein [Gammaproteobacteria bacterium]